MKKIFGSSVAAIAIMAASGAYAADLPVYVEPVEPAPVMAAAPLWTGFYVGAQVGGVFDLGGGDDCYLDGFVDGGFDPDNGTDGEEFDGADLSDLSCSDFGFDDDGDDSTWAAGAHIGYDMQFGSFVVGALVDANWIDDDRGSSFAFDPDEALGGDPFDGKTDSVLDAAFENPDDAFSGYPYQEFSSDGGLQWYGTARLRAGYAPGGGRFLMYATGGLAFGQMDSSYETTAYFTPEETDRYFGDSGIGDPDDFDPTDDGASLPDSCEIVATGNTNNSGVVCSNSGDDDDFMFGFAVGAGAEFLVTDNFSVGAEYLYVNLGDPDFDDFGGGDDDDVDFQSIMVKASFRFGG